MLKWVISVILVRSEMASGFSMRLFSMEIDLRDLNPSIAPNRAILFLLRMSFYKDLRVLNFLMPSKLSRLVYSTFRNLRKGRVSYLTSMFSVSLMSFLHRTRF